MEGKIERKTNYRELQAIAKSLHLPGNLKHHLLIEIIEARKTGNEYIVNKILNDQKLERVRRKKEKLEAREAAYQHLQISQDKIKKPVPQSPPVPDSSTVSNWSDQGSFQANSIRSLLAMPREAFQELMRKTREKAIRRNAKANSRPFYYSEYLQALRSQTLYANQNFMQDSFQSARDNDTMRDDILGENASRNIHHLYPRLDYPSTSDHFESPNQQPKKASFQMKDILGQNDPNWYVSFGQSYCMGGIYESNPVTADVSSMPSYLSDSFTSNFSPLIPSSDHWRNIYEMNQDNYNSRFLEYGGIQAIPGPSTEPASSPNSDTVSATDEDLTKDFIQSGDNFKYNNQSPTENYLAPSSSQHNEDYQDSSYISDLPTVIEETNFLESTHPADRACKIKMYVS